MKPLQHTQISAKTHGGRWQDYSEIHSFLDSSKSACAHFKHRFLLHHREGIEIGVRIFGENIVNSENETIETRRILIEHLIEDVGRIVSVEDWARDLLPNENCARRNDGIRIWRISGSGTLLVKTSIFPGFTCPI